MVVTLTGSLMVVPWVFLMVLSHMAKADGYMLRVFLICMGLAFCPSVLELSTFGFILLPFWVLSFVKSLVVTSRLVSVAVCYSLFR